MTSRLAEFVAAAREKTQALPASGKQIGTHSGGFQADEALACWLLRQLPAYAGAVVVRSRDPEVLKECDIVIDVGGVYDHKALLYDHHQRGFFETFDGEPGKATKPEEATGRWKTKLSASGLVYKHYGKEIVEQLARTQASDTDALMAELYDNFFQAVDAIDNGIEVCDEKKRYNDTSCISGRVARLNPAWNEESDHQDQCRRFEVASSLCGHEFLEQLGLLVIEWLPARGLVLEALQCRSAVHHSGQIITLTSGSMPWKEHLYAHERALGVPGLVKFVLYVDSSGMWRVQAVTVDGTDFTNRVSLLEPWRGIRDEALSAIAGIPNCCFVHATGFIGGNRTFEGALKMAEISVEADAQFAK